MHADYNAIRLVEIFKYSDINKSGKNLKSINDK
jgi:hypothetical protein